MSADDVERLAVGDETAHAMKRGRERLAELQREVGWPTDTDDCERITPELQEAYISTLESAVVGGTAAMTGIARSMRLSGSTLFSRTDTKE